MAQAPTVGHIRSDGGCGAASGWIISVKTRRRYPGANARAVPDGVCTASDTDRIPDGGTDAYRAYKTYGNAKSDGYTDRYGDSGSHGNGNPNADTDSDGNTHADIRGNANGDCRTYESAFCNAGSGIGADDRICLEFRNYAPEAQLLRHEKLQGNDFGNRNGRRADTQMQELFPCG